MQTSMSASYPLHQPIGALMRPLEPLQVEDSLQVAAERMREEGIEIVPVARGDAYVGAITPASLVRAVGAGHSPLEAVGDHVDPYWPAMPGYALAVEALRLLEDLRVPVVVVLDGAGSVAGLFSGANLVAPPPDPIRPRLVGGMATPLGVYLTNGVVAGGAPKWALVLTGALLFLLFVIANVVSGQVHDWSRSIAMSPDLRVGLAGGLAAVLFFAGLRLSPIAGIHAAEHMVVHAIERGEPLNVEVVSRMPRVHPRCGTNLAAGAMLFIGVSSGNWSPDPDLRLLAAVLVTLVFWRPLGSMLQYFVTTKPPTRAQIEMGIAAGRELLDRYQRGPTGVPGIGARLWNSGLPQIILGSSAASLLVYGLAAWTGFEALTRVYF